MTTINDNILLLKNEYFKDSFKYYIPSINKGNIKKLPSYATIIKYINKLKNIKLHIFNIENLNNTEQDVDNFKIVNDFLDNIISNYKKLVNPTEISSSTIAHTLHKGGGIGGHAGDIGMFNFKYVEKQLLGKKFIETEYYKSDTEQEKIKFDKEVLIYLFFHAIYNKINIKEENNKVFNVLHSLTKILTFDKLHNDKIFIGRTEDGSMIFSLGNLKKSENCNILDYKVGSYTINPSEKNINTLLSCKYFNCNSYSLSYKINKIKLLIKNINTLNEKFKTLISELSNTQTGGFIEDIKIFGKYFNDFNSTSNYYGFRCEGVDKLFNNVYHNYLFLTINNEFSLDFNSYNKQITLNIDTNIHLASTNTQNDVNIEISENYYDLTNYEYIKKKIKKPKSNSKIVFNPDNGLYLEESETSKIYTELKKLTKTFKSNSLLLINKNKLFNDLQILHNQYYKNFNKLEKKIINDNNILFKIKYLCVMHHFTFVNYFDYDNYILSKIVKEKNTLFNKAPNYFLHPLIQYNLFYHKYSDAEKKILQNNLNTFIENAILNQFDAILKNEYKLCCAFVGASIITNVNTQDIRLIDFGHPIIFNAANLSYLVKDVNVNLLPEENDKYREIFSIFINFAYGCLSYYFMLTMYLGLFNDDFFDENFKNTIKTVINLLYYSTYYIESITTGFPLLNRNGTNIDVNINTFMSTDIKNKLSTFNTRKFNAIKEINDSLLNVLILPSELEEELLLNLTDNKKGLSASRDKIDLSQKRCDIAKYLYIIRLITILKKCKSNINVNIEIKDYSS